MPVMQEYEKSINSSLVHVLRGKKNKGMKKVHKRDLYKKYGADKLASAKLTADHPEALAAYRRAKDASPTWEITPSVRRATEHGAARFGFVTDESV